MCQILILSDTNTDQLADAVFPKEIGSGSPKNRGPRRPVKPKSVTPVNLKLKRHELETMSELLEVVGNTPRTIKRFINIYRIVRSHPDLGFNSNTDKESYRVLMFLLALSIGEYWRCSPDFFDRLVSGGAKTIGEDLQYLSEKEKETASAAARIEEALNKGGLGDLKDVRIRDFIEEKSIQFIIRFSFANKNEIDI